MKSLWNNTQAKKLADDPLKLRVYTSQLLGQEPDLVLHGGGNTSVKAEAANLFGKTEQILYVKGSGWAVFDTAIWTEEVLKSQAKEYGMSVEQYRKDNLLKTEVTSKDVAALTCAMVGPIFGKTTGAQVPVDGGNVRVV